jgi:Ser/Thr protein kinase RdoA (MazF antagonist)
MDPRADPDLPGLARALVKGGRLVSYRPGRRATLISGPSFLKVVRPKRVAELAEGHDAFSAIAASAGFSTPRIDALDTTLGIVTLQSLPGIQLRQSEPSATVIGQLGYGLAAVHGTEPSRRLSTRPDEDVTWWIEQATHRDPAPTPEFLRALTHAAELAPTSLSSSTSVIHGDLHDGNVLVDGGRLGLIDFDGAGIGDPMRDVVAVAAHLEIQAIRRDEPPPQRLTDALLYGYATAGGSVSRAPSMLAVELLRLACLHRFRRPGAIWSVAMVARAVEVSRLAEAA